MAKRKNIFLCWEVNPSHPAHSLASILTELSWLPSDSGGSLIVSHSQVCCVVLYLGL
jgi:hypothetical protein